MVLKFARMNTSCTPLLFQGFAVWQLLDSRMSSLPWRPDLIRGDGTCAATGTAGFSTSFPRQARVNTLVSDLTEYVNCRKDQQSQWTSLYQGSTAYFLAESVAVLARVVAHSIHHAAAPAAFLA